MILPAAELMKRAAKIRALLRPISRAESGPATETVNASPFWIIGCRDEASASSNYRDWRFATRVNRHHAMYFEAWKQVDGRRFRWHSAYLNIYRRAGADKEVEVICLHCDPAESPSAAHARYKRGPHLHVSAAGDPLKRAHLALHVEYVEQMLQKCQSIHEHLSSGIQMINDEVLGLLDDQQTSIDEVESA